MKLLHTREARIVVRTRSTRRFRTHSSRSRDARTACSRRPTLGCELVDATDEERGALVEAGYALPSHIATGQT